MLAYFPYKILLISKDKRKLLELNGINTGFD